MCGNDDDDDGSRQQAWNNSPPLAPQRDQINSQCDDGDRAHATLKSAISSVGQGARLKAGDSESQRHLGINQNKQKKKKLTTLDEMRVSKIMMTMKMRIVAGKWPKQMSFLFFSSLLFPSLPVRHSKVMCWPRLKTVCMCVWCVCVWTRTRDRLHE